MSASKMFTRFSSLIARQMGRPVVFILSCITIVVWAASGPFFGFSDTWQLIINTGTTIITFLMVFLIQNTQNRDGAAIQAKLDELIRVTERAQNSYIGIEELTDEELDEIRARCAERAHAAEVRARDLAMAASDAADQGEEPIEAARSARAGIPAGSVRRLSKRRSRR